MIYTLPKADKGLLTTRAEAANQLAECYYDNENSALWAYLRASTDLKKGEAVMPLITDEIDVAAAAPAGSRVLTLSTLNSRLTTNVPTGGDKRKANARIVVTTDPGGGQTGTILSYTDTVATIRWDTIDGSLAVALTTSSQVRISADWLAVQSTANAGAMAILQADADSGQYFWGLVEGEGVVLAGAIIAARATLMNHTEAGESVAYTATATFGGYGVTKANADDGELCLANINCNIRISKAFGLGKTGPYIQSYSHPTL